MVTGSLQRAVVLPEGYVVLCPVGIADLGSLQPFRLRRSPWLQSRGCLLAAIIQGSCFHSYCGSSLPVVPRAMRAHGSDYSVHRVNFRDFAEFFRLPGIL